MKGERFQALDSMSTLVAVLDAEGAVRFANAALENALGLSRRTLVGLEFASFFAQPALLQMALTGVRRQEAAGLRFEASLKGLQHELIPAHVNVAAADGQGDILVELWPLEQHARQDREERLREQVQANKELIRNLVPRNQEPARRHYAARRSCSRWSWASATCANTRRSSSTRPTACRT